MIYTGLFYQCEQISKWNHFYSSSAAKTQALIIIYIRGKTGGHNRLFVIPRLYSRHDNSFKLEKMHYTSVGQRLKCRWRRDFICSYLFFNKSLANSLFKLLNCGAHKDFLQLVHEQLTWGDNYNHEHGWELTE